MIVNHRAGGLLLCLALAIALLACGGADTPSGGSAATPAVTAEVGASSSTAPRTAYPFTVAASDNRTLTLHKAPERIVSLSPGHTEILFAIGAGGQVIGTDRFSDYPDATKALPKVEYSNTNLEALVALRPDLVIATARQRMLVAAFEQAGLKVLFLDEPASVAEVIRRVRLLGDVTDRRGPATELARRMEERVAAVVDRVKGVTTGPRVYHEIDPKLFSAASASFVGDLYTLLKAQNIAQDVTTMFPQLTAEAIIRADPEVIVLGDGLFPGGTPDEVKRRPGWTVIGAVKNGRVYPVDDNTVSRPGPRVVDGLEQIARLLYPDLFR